MNSNDEIQTEINGDELDRLLQTLISIQLDTWNEYQQVKADVEAKRREFEKSIFAQEQKLRELNASIESLRLQVNSALGAVGEAITQKKFVQDLVRVQIRERVVIDDPEQLKVWAKAYDSAYVPKSNGDVVALVTRTLGRDVVESMFDIDERLATKLAKDLVTHDPSTPAHVEKYVTEVSREQFEKVLSTLQIILGE